MKPRKELFYVKEMTDKEYKESEFDWSQAMTVEQFLKSKKTEKIKPSKKG